MNQPTQRSGSAPHHDNPVVQFLAVTDVHFADRPAAAPMEYPRAQRRLQRAMDREHGRRRLDFAVQLGDIIQEGWDSFDTVMPTFLGVPCPVYHVLGNHDFLVAPSRIEDVPERIGLARRYHAFDVNGWRFLVLDGNDVSLHGRPEGSDQHKAAAIYLDILTAHNAPQARTWNGALGHQQLQWLDEQLDAADRDNLPVGIFCHLPVRPLNMYILWNAEVVEKIVTAHRCVRFFMNGHAHQWCDVLHGGVHWITLPAFILPPHPVATVRLYDEGGPAITYRSLQNKALT